VHLIAEVRVFDSWWANCNVHCSYPSCRSVTLEST